MSPSPPSTTGPIQSRPEVRILTSASAALCTMVNSVSFTNRRQGRLGAHRAPRLATVGQPPVLDALETCLVLSIAHAALGRWVSQCHQLAVVQHRSEEHTSELQ